MAAQTVACGSCEEVAETIEVAHDAGIDMVETDNGTYFANAESGVDEKCKGVCRVQRGYADTLETCAVLGVDQSRYSCTFTHTECSGMASRGHCGMGRPPAGYVALPRAAGSLGEFFAHAAELEAASIPAFLYLARDLERLGAPAALVQAANEARHDEVRHARTMRDLARRHGAKPRWAKPCAHVEGRRLVDVAIENAVEGCVNETYSALLATWAAANAEDESVRAAMATIAADETRHAALAWEIDAWARAMLSPAEAEEVVQARRRAAAELTIAMASRPASPALARAGVEPLPSESGALARALVRALG